MYEYLLKYSDLHLEYFWRTSCYIYPPPPPSEWSILTRIPYIFPVVTPYFWQTTVVKLCMPMSSHLRGW